MSEWYQNKMLLIDKKNHIEVDQSEFYGDRLKSELGVNSSYVSTIQKKFYRFRVIQIMETNEVFEHFSFTHPYYGDDKFQRIFFSENLDYMLERQEQNVLLYRRSLKVTTNTPKMIESLNLTSESI